MDPDMVTAGALKRDQLQVFSDKLAQYLGKLETFMPEKYRGIPDESLQVRVCCELGSPLDGPL
jgi:hypothetical protein